MTTGGGRAADPVWLAPGLREPRYSQSLGRGLAILSVFTPERGVLGITDIADELGMSRSTTHRYVITLVALGYLEQDSSHKYRLGLGVADLGMSAIQSAGLRKHARPHLEQLRRQTSLTSGLGVLEGSDALYVDRMSSFRGGHSETELSLRPGSRVPSYCTAIGKLLLAHLPEAQRRELISSLRLAKRAAHTITSRRALDGELEEIRDAGFAVSDQELTASLVAIAAPVRNEAREVIAAVDLAARSSLISAGELAGSLAAHLRASADRISAQLGHRHDCKLAVGA
jgi:IclR family pca regulon transcriptional regulator